MTDRYDDDEQSRKLGEIRRAMFTDIDRNRDELARADRELAERCPYETRVAIAAWVIRELADHVRCPGYTYRGFVYGRLHFRPDAFFRLYDAGLMGVLDRLRTTTDPIVPY